MGQAERLADLLDVCGDIAPAEPGKLSEQLKVPPDRERGVDTQVLGCDTDIAAGLEGLRDGVHAVDEHGSSVRPAQSCHARDERGLASAVVPQEAGDLTGLDLEVDALQHLQRSVGLAYAARVENRLGLRGAEPLRVRGVGEDDAPSVELAPFLAERQYELEHGLSNPDLVARAQ